MSMGTSEGDKLWPHCEQYGRKSDLLQRSADEGKLELSGNNMISREHIFNMWTLLGSVELDALSPLLK